MDIMRLKTGLKVLATLVVCISCKQNSSGNYGKKVSNEGIIQADALLDSMGGVNGYKTKVEGTVISVCQHEGCWFDMDMGDGSSMRVVVKNKSFHLPDDLSGKMVIAEGKAYFDTVSVSQLKQLAKGKNLAQEQIDEIKNPEVGLKFIAEGVLIK